MKKLSAQYMLTISILLFGLFALLGLYISFSPYNSIDVFIMDTMRSIYSHNGIYFMTGITDSYQSSKIAGLLLIALFLCRKYVITAGLAVALFVNNYLTSETKSFFGRSRPGDMLVDVGGKSYPSGHTSTITILSFFVIWAIYTSIKKVWMRNVAITCVVVYAVLIMVSRMYLSVHWFTDVAGGFLLATAIGFLIAGFIEKENKHI